MATMDAIDAYVDSPTPHNADRLRRAILQDETFDRRSPWHEHLWRLHTQERYDETIRVVRSLMPGLWLSPDAHLMLATAHTALGRTQEAERERYLWRLALDAALKSGDGTQESPWPVLHVADMYTILSELGVAPTEQRAQGHGGQIVDAITCSDGQDRWFRLVEVNQ